MKYYFVIALISFSLVSGYGINPFRGLPEDFPPLQNKLNQLKAKLKADFYEKYPNLQPIEDMAQRRVVAGKFVNPIMKKSVFVYVMRVI